MESRGMGERLSADDRAGLPLIDTNHAAQAQAQQRYPYMPHQAAVEHAQLDQMLRLCEQNAYLVLLNHDAQKRHRRTVGKITAVYVVAWLGTVACFVLR